MSKLSVDIDVSGDVFSNGGGNTGEGAVLKEGTMKKKAIGKSTFGRKTTKSRWFRLTSSFLSYYENQEAKTPKGRLDVGNIIRVQADPDNGNGLHIVHYRVEDGDGDQGVVDPKEYTLSCETFSPSARDDWLTTLSAAVVEQDGDGDLEVSGGGGGSREAHQPKTKKVIDGAEGEVEFGGFDSDDYGDD